MLRISLFVLCFVTATMSCAAEPLQFGVLNQRSILLTARLWNPILEYASAKSGVPLTLKIGKTARNAMAMTVRSEFDFVYTNYSRRKSLVYRILQSPRSYLDFPVMSNPRVSTAQAIRG